MPRIGFGYDSHRFESGRPLVLGGIRLEHDQGLAGHSDADVVLHALTDAILGALAAGDIGEHFPDTDPAWEAAESSRFVHEAITLCMKDGYGVQNCDITVFCERPKLGAHKQAMRQNIAELLGVAPEAVSVKAKTNEGLGFIGRGEGIAAVAVVLLDTSDGQ